MKTTSLVSLLAAASLSSTAFAQAPAAMTVTADVLSVNASFSDPAYNQVQPGQPVTFTCSVDVIPYPSTTTPLFTYRIDPGPVTLDIGIAVSTGPVTPEPTSLFAMIDNQSGSTQDVVGVVADLPGGIQFLSVEQAPLGGILTSDLLTQNGSIATTNPGGNTLFQVSEPGTAASIVLQNVSIAVNVPGSLGTSYCPTVANSTGESGSLTIAGSPVVGANDVHLLMHQLPPSMFGMALASQTQGSFANPNGSGTICLGGTIGRFNGATQIQLSDAKGFARFQVDLTSIPQGLGLVSVLPGETWNFQYWHRDIVGGSQTSNLTNAVSVPFL